MAKKKYLSLNKLSEYTTLLLEKVTTYINAKIGDAVADVKTDSSNKDAAVLAQAQKSINEVQTNLDAHTENNDIHVTQNDKDSWNDKATTGYVTEYVDGQVSTAVTNVKEDASNKDAVVLLEAQKGINTVQTNLNTHTENNDIHVTIDERKAWNDKATTGYVTEYVDTQVAALVNSAPDKLNTLDELAAALGDDDNFATTVTNSLADKASKEELNTHAINAVSHITDDERNTWNNKSDFSGFYDDLENAPSIKEDESKSVVYVDENDNVIAKVDANGFETTTVTADSVVINGKDLELTLDGKADSNHVHEQYLVANDIVGKANQTYVDEQLATKAPAEHSHDTSDITSGTLSTDRLPVIPVEKGGTGATTAENALTNLGAAPAEHSHTHLTLKTVEYTLPSSAGWSSVVYGDGKFVAVGRNSDKVVYSTNGVDWIESTLPSNTYWSAVTYGNGKFVTIAYNTNKVAHSTDGIEWTETTLPYTAKWGGITYGNDKFIAVGKYVVCSTDGINWEHLATLYDFDWNAVAYGDGKFVAVSSNASPESSNSSKAAYSADGTTWAHTTIPNANWHSVAYGDGKFVAVAYNNVASSPIGAAYTEDGITWTEVTMPDNVDWTDIIYGDGKFVAVVQDASSTHVHAAYSEDGINWIAASSENGGTSVAYGDGKFVTVKRNSNKFGYSTDGINWQSSREIIEQDDANVTDLVKAVVNVAGVSGGGSNIVYSVATKATNGLMSSSDKTKLDGIVLATTSEVKTYLGI